MKNHTPHYDEDTNSVHEKNTNALRLSAKEVGPSTKIDKSYVRVY